MKIIKNVIPLALKKSEHNMWTKSNYSAIAFIANSFDDLKKVLLDMLDEILNYDSTIYLIAWASDEIAMKNIMNVFDESFFIKSLPPLGDYLVKSGAVVMCFKYDIETIKKVVKYWGILDKTQIIIPILNKEDDIRKIVCEDRYIYKRHNSDVLTKLMDYAEIMINDTGDGEEFELICHKLNEKQIKALINYISIENE